MLIFPPRLKKSGRMQVIHDSISPTSTIKYKSVVNKISWRNLHPRNKLQDIDWNNSELFYF